MNVPGFVRLLKKNSQDSEVWWDDVPGNCSPFKKMLVSRYPHACEFIEGLLSDHFQNVDDGVSGATTNPRLVTRSVLEQAPVWREWIQALERSQHTEDAARQVYDQTILEGARQLQPLWRLSGHRYGWLSAQIDVGQQASSKQIVARGLGLASLAPNVMIKVPGSEAGYRAIEQLVAAGCSINNTLCFTVAQAQACLKAVHNGRLRAQSHGVNTEHAHYVISFMIGRLGAEPELQHQARERRLHLSLSDRRWAELAVYQALQALLRSSETPVRLLLCSLKVDTDARGHESCWHLERTGSETTLYTLPRDIVEFIVRRHQQGVPVKPATEPPPMPAWVRSKLLALPYFCQAYFRDGLQPADFARHPAFLTASNDIQVAHEQLQAFVDAVFSAPGFRPASGRGQASMRIRS